MSVALPDRSHATAAQSVSAVIVSYFTGPTLNDCLDAVEGQVDEIVLVDNGNPAQVSAALAADPRITVIAGHGNIGFGAACNLGAWRTSGAMLLFLNPDAVIAPGAVAALTTAGADKARPWLVGGRLTDTQGREQRGSRRDMLTPWRAFVHATGLSALEPIAPLFRDMHRERDPTPGDVVAIPVVSGAFFLTPKADFNRVGGFDEGYFLHVEDIDLCQRYSEAGGGVWHQPHACALHRGHTSAVSSAFVAKHKAAGFRRFFNRTARRPIDKLIAATLSLGMDIAVQTHAALKRDRR